MERMYRVQIAAPAAVVFQWLTNGERMKEWMSGLEAFSFQQTGTSLAGASFQQTMRTPFANVTWNGTVTAYEENQLLGLLLQASMVEFRMRYELHEEGDETHVRHVCHIRPGLWLGAMLPMMVSFCDGLFQQQLEQLKRCVESA